MNNIIIMGAGGTGVQVADAIEEINRKRKQWNLRGFLDDDEKKQGLEINGYPVLGKINDAQSFDDCFFVVTLGNPKNYYIRKKVVKKLRIYPQRFATIVHPDATVSRHATIGYGTVILAGARVMPNVKIGNHVLVLSNSYSGHNDVIQDFVTVANSVSIAGGTTIEEGCYIGANASIKERIKIGKWSLVGMGSVILEDVPPFSVIVGNPGRIIRTLDPSTFDI